MLSQISSTAISGVFVSLAGKIQAGCHAVSLTLWQQIIQ
jgi:hypothetical protein